MILRIPDYFEDFACIGGKCKKSCCIGWELEVDPDTFDYYQTVPGPFGNRIRNELKKGETDEFCGFTLPVDGRCPFLNSDNLCDIVLELGEEALCDICSNYPRHTFSYGNYLEKGLTISCEEACRLLFEAKEGLRFKEIEIPDSDFDEEDDITEDEIIEFEHRQLALFEILYDVDLTFDEKINRICGSHDYPELRSKEERLHILSILEPIDSEWIDSMGGLLNRIDSEDLPWDNEAYSKLLTYFLYRYLPRGLYDGDLGSKIRFAVFCVYCIRDLENLLLHLPTAASQFSREVEHSDENIDRIMEELLFL